MSTWIVLLRAINIGKRRYPMAELRAALTEAGYEGVETHIQTGNVRLDSSRRGQGVLETELEKVFEGDRGFFVAAIALQPKELRQIADDVDKLTADHTPAFGHYVSVLRAAPSAADAAALEALSKDGERIVVRGRAVHLLYDVPYHEAKVSNAAIEKRISVATNRNAKVIRAMATKWAVDD